MSANVLLNLLNELSKSDKMRGLPSILSLFRNKFNKFNNGAKIVDSIHHMTLKLLLNLVFARKTLRFCHIYLMLIWTSSHSLTKICKLLVVYQFYCTVLYHSQTRRHMIKLII